MRGRDIVYVDIIRVMRIVKIRKGLNLFRGRGENLI